MSGDHGYDPFGLGEPNPAMEAAVAEITELQGKVARLREECERLRAALVGVCLDGIISSGSGPAAPVFDEFDVDIERNRGRWYTVSGAAIDTGRAALRGEP